MKKLFIKIKAKRYDEAIERAKSLVDFCSDSELKTLEYVFPELKEELEDEKIRKALIFDYRGDDCLCTKEYRIDFKDIRAWLEKQGNTNETIDRDEFAQGVLRGAAINLITWIDYNAAKGNMCLSNMECKDIEDALVSGDWDKIYAYMKKKLEKQGEQMSYGQREECFDCQFNYAGECKGSCAMKRSEQKPWGEEDEKRLQSCLNVLQPRGIMGVTETINTKWLKSLKERIQPKQEWSEEDEKNFKKAIKVLKVTNFHHTADMLQEMKYKLISSEKTNWKPSDEQIEALESATENCAYSEYQDCLHELIIQLKKLKEELL